MLLGHYHIDGLGVMQICGPALWSSSRSAGHSTSARSRSWGALRGCDDAQLVNLLRSSALAISPGLIILLASPWLTDVLTSGWVARRQRCTRSRGSTLPPFLCAPFKLLGGLFFSALQSQRTQDPDVDLWDLWRRQPELICAVDLWLWLDPARSQAPRGAQRSPLRYKRSWRWRLSKLIPGHSLCHHAQLTSLCYDQCSR